MNKSEILNLHTLSEDKQFQWLLEKDVLKSEKVSLSCNCGGWSYVTESLADCAFRLRDGVARTKGLTAFTDALAVITTRANISYDRAKPIHWIMTALLAKLEKGKNDGN